MKKTSLTLIFFSLLYYGGFAQSYIGYLTDNYSGIHGVISNPASIADSRFRTDINLIGTSALIGNDYVGVNFNAIFDEEYNFDDAKKNAKTENNFFVNTDILGPAFMLNLNDISSIALFTRGRIFYSINDINGETFENFIDDDIEGNTDFSINEDSFSFTANAWAEIGVTYAREIFNTNEHYVKGGLTLKYLKGFGNIYANGENVNIDYDADGTSPTNGSITSQGDLFYGSSSDNFDDFEAISKANGFAADLGFIYEWRPDYKEYKTAFAKDKNKYKLKIGLSLTDLGSINYKEGKEEAYNINNTISESDFNSLDFDDALDAFYTKTDSNNATKATLPSALHLNADWNLNNKFYVNLNTDFSLVSRTKTNTNRIANLVSLTPRYESKWFSFYSPVSYLQHSGFQWGAGLRAGPLYLGSGSVLSLLISDNSKAADAYVGLKIPFYQSKPKDKDGDGVIDKLDGCKDIKGPLENNGCPWKDKDGDTVLDKDDNCPGKPGPIENNGCPWEDTDRDTILDKDDDCPEEAGTLENKGCPEKDTDGDTIFDKDDNCPTVAGTVENNGCPEVSKTVQKELNNFAKTILFNSGKSTIKSDSYNSLDEIVSILKEYPNAKFVVEGHTDNVGNNALNQELSTSRANAVKNYLINNGIDQSRLTAIGYGEDRPLLNNGSKENRAINRRVEININR